MNTTASEFVLATMLGTPAMQHGAAIPAEGIAMWSTRMHPVYDSYVEIRIMPTHCFALFHHYGEDSIAWKDEHAPEFATFSEAIEQVREYQRTFQSCCTPARLRFHQVS
ncbi:hypothetical protein [Burkholderia sp. Ac-20365]|uniref:hypothetical protein n=1 Tax=Burkholderia sp. Ac-20365 TaxID=2703897 RepID=UPI00197C22EE|nr:hypothetical protein [Burkholderia sp. Ac-20365]MBN3760911.1 hypothetical protein [Burkholderia sp. Ac-20365]